MTTKRVNLIGGGLLAGAFLLGTAGLALAQGPTPSPGTNWTGPGGTMGGQGQGQGMGGQGMTGSMDADHLKAMAAMHAKMTASGRCDPAAMNGLHGKAGTDR